MLVSTLKILENSGLTPKLKDEGEGREIEYGYIHMSHKGKNEKLPANRR